MISYTNGILKRITFIIIMINQSLYNNIKYFAVSFYSGDFFLKIGNY